MYATPRDLINNPLHSLPPFTLLPGQFLFHAHPHHFFSYPIWYPCSCLTHLFSHSSPNHSFPSQCAGQCWGETKGLEARVQKLMSPRLSQWKAQMEVNARSWFFISPGGRGQGVMPQGDVGLWVVCLWLLVSSQIKNFQFAGLSGDVPPPLSLQQVPDYKER